MRSWWGGGGAGVVEVNGGENELLLFGGREDLVEVDGDSQRDEEETADAGFDPVLGLEWGRRHELGPEGQGALGAEDGGGVGDGFGFGRW